VQKWEGVDLPRGGERWWVGAGRVGDGRGESGEFGAKSGLEGGVLGEAVEGVGKCYAGGFVAGG